MDKAFCIVHYNTNILTRALVSSINKNVEGAEIYIFDNSDVDKFTNTFENVTVFDNTEGKIINFGDVLSHYPNRHKSLGRFSNFGSFKHCISVDKCMDLIGKPFILLDSDVLLKKDVSGLFDADKYFVSSVKDWSWNTGPTCPHHKRCEPFICFINTDKCKSDGIRYYDDKHMDGLYNTTFDADSYDTGCWFYEKCKDKPNTEINKEEYIVHFGGGSYMGEKGRNRMTREEFLKRYESLYDKSVIEGMTDIKRGEYSRVSATNKRSLGRRRIRRTGWY